MKNKKMLGFTLIELMVVISIIAILATMGVNSYAVALKRGRDAKRISDIHQIKQALVMYRADKGAYPAENQIWIDNGLPPTYLSAKPVCPKPDNNGYVYTPALDLKTFALGVQLELSNGNSEVVGSVNLCSNGCNFYVVTND